MDVNNCHFRCPWNRLCSCEGSEETEPEECDTANFLKMYMRTVERMDEKRKEGKHCRTMTASKR